MLISIISTPRSGSTMLTYIINQYRSINGKCRLYNETIHWKNGKHNANLASHMASFLNESLDYDVVIKNHVNVLHRHELMMDAGTEPIDLIEEWNKFAACKKYTILSIRQDIIEQAISMAYAATTKIWSYDEPMLTNMSIAVPEESMVNAINVLINHYNLMYAKYLRDADELVVYEKMGNTPREIYSRLSIDSSKVSSDYDFCTHPAPNKQQVISNIAKLNEIGNEFVAHGNLWFPIKDNCLDISTWEHKLEKYKELKC